MIAIRKGIKKIAVVSSYGHHASPINWAMDSVAGEGQKNTKFNFGGSDFVHSSHLGIDNENPEWDVSWNEICQKQDWGEYGIRLSVKDWREPLKVLLRE